MQADAIISVSVKVTEHGVVALPRQAQTGIRDCGSGSFNASPQGEQFRNPGERLVLAPRICVVGSRIAIVRFVPRHGIFEGRSVSLPGAVRQEDVEQDRRFLGWEEILVVIDFRSWEKNRIHVRATRKGWAAPLCFPVPESCSNQRQPADNVAADRDQSVLAASRRCPSTLRRRRVGSLAYGCE